MTSEIRANTLKNRVGLGTVSFTNTGPVVSGIVTATTFVGGLPITSGADNRVITASSASAIQGEANLIYNGTGLGVGETSPANLLHVKVSDAGIAPHPSAQIVLERSGTNYLQFLTAANGTSGLLFGDTNDIDVAKIVYDHNIPAMQFVTETVERLRITSDGKLGLMTASPDFLFHAKETGGSSVAGLFETNQTDAYICFQASGTSASSTVRIGAVGNDFQAFVNGGEKLRITSTGLLQGTSGQHDGGLELLSGNNNQSTRLRIQSKSSGGTAYNWYLDSARSADRFTIHDGSTSWLTILGTGNVGINDTSPDRQFHVNSGATNECARFESTDTEVTLEFKDLTGTASLKCRNDFRFNNSTGEKARIDSSGRLLVGLASDPAESSIVAEGNSNSGTNYAVLDLRRGSAASSAGNVCGYIRFSDTNIDSSSRNYAWIAGMADGASSAGNDNPGRLVFATCPDGSTSLTERLRITSDGFVGINKTDPKTGLTINKYGTQPVVNGNTYPYPAGNWSTVWNTGTANSTDYWCGFVGSYNVSSATVNISLSPNIFNFSTQQGIYIAGEATSTSSADFTVGKLIGGSAGGASASAGNQRATKSEMFRITSSGNVGIGTDTGSGTTRLHVYHPSVNTVAKFESGDAGAGFLLQDPTCGTRLEQTGATFKIDVDAGSDTTGEVISFQMSGSEKLRIDSNGNLKQGTSTPAAFTGGAPNHTQRFLGKKCMQGSVTSTVTLSGSGTGTFDLGRLWITDDSVTEIFLQVMRNDTALHNSHYCKAFIQKVRGSGMTQGHILYQNGAHSGFSVTGIQAGGYTATGGASHGTQISVTGGHGGIIYRMTCFYTAISKNDMY